VTPGPPGGSRTRHSLTSGPASNIAVVFVVARNSEYAALKKFIRLLDAPNTPGLELPDMDIVGIATSYGIPAEHLESLSDLTRPTKDALASDGPRLIEVTQRRLADS
jgi:benzoylformate decarboxylase